MILLEIGGSGFLLMIVLIYIVLHLPAFILLALGLHWRKTKPERSKVMLIIAGVYFLIGAGVCGGMF